MSTNAAASAAAAAKDKHDAKRTAQEVKRLRKQQQSKRQAVMKLRASNARKTVELQGLRTAKAKEAAAARQASLCARTTLVHIRVPVAVPGPCVCARLCMTL
jgi:hypothetical protein